jgi:HPt (histidine-containing phosphotransfer) domain-containing protein
LQPTELFERVESFAPQAPGNDKPHEPRAASKAETAKPLEPNVPALQIDAASFFDKSNALKHVGGDEELLAEIIKEFCGQYPQLLTQIREAISKADLPLLRRAAHTLKGNAGTLGAATACELAQHLETLGETGDLADAENLCDQLEQALSQLQPALLDACS